MSDLYWLTDEQMERLRPFFPKSHGKPRVDDCKGTLVIGVTEVRDFMGRPGTSWDEIWRAAAAIEPGESYPQSKILDWVGFGQKAKSGILDD